MITTQSVYESDAFDIVVFVFPANAAIPLHDHPAMTVFSKVLYGALAMVSFDWAAPPSAAELDAFTREQARLEELAAGAHRRRTAAAAARRRRCRRVQRCSAPTPS